MNKKTQIAILVLVGFAVYFRVLFNGFVWDDEEFILNNPMVHSIGNLAAFFGGGSYSAGGSGIQFGSYYRPVMMTIYSAVYTIFGPNAFFFHLFQVASHIGSAILVFFLFRKIFGEQILPFFLALIFLVHPMNVEAVSFISATQEILFLFTGILALLFIDNVYLTALFLLVSFLLKETGLVFVPIILVYVWLFKRCRFVSCFLVTTACLGIYFVLRLGVAKVSIETGGLFPIMQATFLERLLTIPSILAFYFQTFFLPINLAIARHWVVRGANLVDFVIPLIFSGFFLAAAPFYFIKKKDRAGLFLFFLMMIGLLPYLQLIPLNMTAAERWFYLPIVGMLGMTGRIVQNARLKAQSFVLIFLILIVVLSARTVLRTFDWRNGLSLYSHDIIMGRHAFDLENNLGVELFRNGDYQGAKTHFEKSVDLAPFWWVNWNNLGAVYERDGDLISAAKYYEKAMKNGDYYLAFENYAFILIKQKKLQEARKFLESEALLKFPDNDRLKLAYSYISQQLQPAAGESN